ncbi:hypothetical protein ACFQ1I_05470 [Kitasatospora arboriphila]
MPSDTLAPPSSAAPTTYRTLLRTGQFAALFTSFTLTVAANALAASPSAPSSAGRPARRS